MDLEQRIARLEAIEAIKRLKATYAEACDDGYNPEKMFHLFTADAVWEEPTTFGVHHGRDAICAFFAGVSAPISFALHYTDAPHIDISADLLSATCDWYIFMPFTSEGSPSWLMATYHDEYRVDEGAWKFAHVTIAVEALTPYADGWVKTRFMGA